MEKETESLIGKCLGTALNADQNPAAQNDPSQRYLLTSLLGKQTGRRTFLAEDLETERLVVVKLVLFGPDFTWEDLKLFEREAETLKSLDHPAIPQYLDSFEVDTPLGQGFALVQTYIEAPSLQEWVGKGATFGEDELRAIARDLLSILEYLHHRQPPVIHRDIKPSNILFAAPTDTTPGGIYLVDFGSVQTNNASGTITVVGTYGYMPPEQFGGRAEPASDLYSVGATLIYLATGKHPAELTQTNLQLDFDDTLLSPSFSTWLRQLTYADLERRLPSAAQALQRLEELKNSKERTKVKQSSKKAKRPSSAILKSTFNDLSIDSTPQVFIIQLSAFRLSISQNMTVVSSQPLRQLLSELSPWFFFVLIVMSCFVAVVFPDIVHISFFVIFASFLGLFIELIDDKKVFHQIRLISEVDGSISLSVAKSSFTKHNTGWLSTDTQQPNSAILQSVELHSWSLIPGLVGSRMVFHCSTNRFEGNYPIEVSGSPSQIRWLSEHLERWEKV